MSRKLRGREAVFIDSLLVSQRLVPELTEKVRTRYRVLKRIELHQPVGRRTLAHVLGVSERVLRADVEVFKEQGLIEVGPLGMAITETGVDVLQALDPIMKTLDGRAEMELSLAERLGIARVVVVSGDSEQSEDVTRDVGQAAAHVLRTFLHPPCTVAVTGGSSLAMLAELMPQATTPQDVEVVPARGGLGERHELLANTIASQLAARLSGRYRMFHVPESLSRATAERLAQEPTIAEMIDRIRSANLVVHGIGDALTMATRRGLDEETVAHLALRGAVAEAFGYFFDAEGHIVHMMNTVGLKLEDLSGDKMVIGVAGGRAKGPAIEAVAHAYRMDALVTDEGAARAILKKGECTHGS
ncbi:sugar-binding transcriptional regulator [Ferroacidibacillus organovorans]|uniref:sugar-binding transcriptional regulator n=1 Tax=Ferroacidibacillus organovorans TaxID=1765683 RepID=UPI0011788DFE|nr:sugar-binding domain-containing protein [Ferroacidibacillus organovorans]